MRPTADWDTWSPSMDDQNSVEYMQEIIWGLPQKDAKAVEY